MPTANQGIESGRGREGMMNATSNVTQQRLAACKPQNQLPKWQLQSQYQLQRCNVCDKRNVDIWVATDLEILDGLKAGTAREDILHGGKKYRRLSPDYFMWITKRFFNFKRAVEKKLVDRKIAEIVDIRFNSIKSLANRFFNPDDFDAAKRRLNILPMPSLNNKGKTIFMFPADATLPICNPVSDWAIAQVDAVKDNAISLGWTESSLYQNQGTFAFPYGFDWGIVNFIDNGDRLGEVTSRTIELKTSTGSVLRFYNKNICQF